MYGDLLNAINNLLEIPISIGSLPINNGMAMYIGSGAVDEIYLDKGSLNQLSLVVNAKNTNQLTCLNNLASIHKRLTLKKIYFSNDEFEITDISTSTVPNLIGTETSGQYLYGSILKVSFYIKGDES